MEKKKPFGWAFIGAGNIAHTVAGEIGRTENHKINSVYNRTYEKARNFTTRFGGTPCRTIEECVNAEGVEGVYINTVPSSHFQLAGEVLSLGKPVLLEKPFTLNRKQGEELFALAEEKGVYLAEAMWTWFSPVASRVREWVQTGEVGEVRKVKLHFAIANGLTNPRLMNPRTGGGALLDLGIYPLAYCHHIWGMPGRIQCEGRLKKGVDLWDRIHLSYPDGPEAEIFTSIIRFKYPKNLLIEGSKGRIESFWFHKTGKVKLIRSRQGSEIFRADGSYANQFDLVSDEIRRGLLRSEYVPPRSTLGTLEMADICRNQIGLKYPSERE